MTKCKCPACGSKFLEQADDKIAGVGIISCMECGENYAYPLRVALDYGVDGVMHAWRKRYEERLAGDDK